MTLNARDQYHLIVIDAFTSDAIPVHLLTREALALVLYPGCGPAASSPFTSPTGTSVWLRCDHPCAGRRRRRDHEGRRFDSSQAARHAFRPSGSSSQGTPATSPRSGSTPAGACRRPRGFGPCGPMTSRTCSRRSRGGDRTEALLRCGISCLPPPQPVEHPLSLCGATTPAGYGIPGRHEPEVIFVNCEIAVDHVAGATGCQVRSRISG